MFSSILGVRGDCFVIVTASWMSRLIKEKAGYDVINSFCRYRNKFANRNTDSWQSPRLLQVAVARRTSHAHREYRSSECFRLGLADTNT